MIEKIISENPENHWRFLNVKNKRVLDMGCSFWDSSFNEGWLSSSEYFISKDAIEVIGFDSAMQDIEKYERLYGNDDRYTIFFMHMDSEEKMRDVLNRYKPQVIKCDIEGAEIFFDNITEDEMWFVDEIAIEYHNDPTREMCERKIKEWNFNNHQIYQLGEYDINRVGVYHYANN
jgi:hypothetical protein